MPVGALALRELRLVVSEACTECGRCVAACAAGALQLGQGAPPACAKAPGERHDVVVVGAGPGGATAAYIAAKAGLSVLMLEKRQEIGSPV